MDLKQNEQVRLGTLNVQLNVQLADLSIWEWFVRCLRLSVGLLLVSVAMSIPVVLFYGALMAKLLAK